VSYLDYSNDLLLALYRLHRELGPDRYISFEDIHTKARIQISSFYLPRFTEEWEDYYLDLSKHIGPHASWSARMKPPGYSYVENTLLSLDDDEDDISDSIAISDEVEAELLPAAGRMVTIDHNSPEYEVVRAAIGDLRGELEASRGEFTGSNSQPPAELDRLIFSLAAADQLWQSCQLKVIQIKVGIILALEEVAEALLTLGKCVAIEIAVDALKQIVKRSTGFDF
jgi:hypothetical protein